MITVKDTSNVEKLLKVLNKLYTTSIQIGIFGDDKDSTVLMIARVQEFGLQIKVTDKMRGYLAANGLYLKKTTEFINIPERSYIRAGFDKERETFLKAGQRLLSQVISLNLPPETFFETYGDYLSKQIRKFLNELSSPPNHPYTIKNKGSSNPLVNTGRLRDSITYKVESR